MFDFKSLATITSSDAPATLAALFEQLDRKATHTSLRPPQLSALGSLDTNSEIRDLVIKMSTGSEKTFFGLAYAEMMRRRYMRKPVVYLCPTTQLVEQVLRTAHAIGVPVSTFAPKGLPYDALQGDSELPRVLDFR
ncbi:DEAD/DEAH box helicase family protein [Undibacterium jejuense]|uniref:DEAD/DEAH box helicase family protein n=1 Tax=Undibacterium jejuense TaxID=1344949 RepID=A0A923HES7_9BURK|nr:DEAD/DEAH box helicase family protein [Undibacterium jejuense]MBC3862434.1 DEAD/DEAH box helicase family protein [Undibacterium jejuense]